MVKGDLFTFNYLNDSTEVGIFLRTVKYGVNEYIQFVSSSKMNVVMWNVVGMVNLTALTK